MEEVKVIKDLPKSYLAAIRNSIGSHTWQNLYATVDGKEEDVMRSGELSCAYFVTSILAMFGLIDRGHATVASTVEKLADFGWKKVSTPAPGDILIWENETYDDGTSYPHIGFFVGNQQAISNSYSRRWPAGHDWKFTDSKPRKITAIWHKDLSGN